MQLEKRSEKGKLIRKSGLLPGVIYGKEIDPMNVKVNEKAFKKALKEFGKNMVFDVDLDGKKHKVYFKDYQVNPIKHAEIWSFDLQKVSANDTMTTDIPINILGREKFEGKALLVQQILSSVHCEYPVGEGVSHFDLDVSSLEQGDALYVKDIDVPKSFKVLSDLDAMVVNVQVPSAIEEPETDAEETLETEEVTEEAEPQE